MARTLLDPMFGSWGVRTMAVGEGGFNPVSYRTGSVWPHDNSLIVARLARYGFGFERDHYDVSMKVSERVLLPAVRRLSDDALIIADGFSCREQIAQATDRRALQLAEVLEMGSRRVPPGRPGVFGNDITRATTR